MVSNYYICEVSSDRVEQSLDQYESELDFQPIWISIDDAISRNQDLFKYPKDQVDTWVVRELFVLRALKDYFQ
jgi:hypothetical protein